MFPLTYRARAAILGIAAGGFALWPAGAPVGALVSERPASRRPAWLQGRCGGGPVARAECRSAATPPRLETAVTSWSEGKAAAALPVFAKATSDPILGGYALLFMGRAQLALGQSTRCRVLRAAADLGRAGRLSGGGRASARG